MSKREYHLVVYGKPRFHIRNCKIIQGFKARGLFTDKYRWANDYTVPVCDMDDNFIDKTIHILPLCQYCAEIQRSEQSDIYKDNEDFVNELKKAIPQETVTDVDVLGYTKEWQDISKHYREKHKYTCERCGVHITNVFDYGYIHCHHRNGNKTDNRDENLECLCIECHSNVDKSHKIRFSKGANGICLQEFIKKYRRNKGLPSSFAKNIPMI